MKMKMELNAQPTSEETTSESMARATTTPECLSASVLTICQKLDYSHVHDMVGELKRQTAAIHNDDMRRVESMLIAQAHTLDSLFARLTVNALTCDNLNVMERYMRLALKAQGQARTTLQTLAELKTPKQVAFVKQANIGNQLQVNNASDMHAPAHARENQNGQNELLEVEDGERLDTRAARTAGSDDPSMATLAEEHWPYQL